MRAFIKNYMDALKKQREERGEDGGFSLIELIVVVVILGVLVAIAIPVFLGLQDQATRASTESAAANGATQLASQIASEAAAPAVPADDPATDTSGFTYTFQADAGAGVTELTADVDEVCVRATHNGSSIWAESGPGCTGNSTSW